MVKHILILLLSVLLPCAYAMAQGGKTAFTGTVTNGEGKAVGNVTCKLLDGKDSLLAYALTKSDGTYRIEAVPEGRRIEFAFLGYETLRTPLQEGRTRYDARLERTAVELENVTVTADPITRRKDTLLYNVDAFRQEQDRSIEDVLKRMPGIEVSDDGQISYQGKAINKVNIEGLDLMGGQYNQATQNMPAEAVAQVQIMERNQPIKALEGRVNNDRATLNLKLKKGYKARPFGEVEGGIGGSPTAWDNHLTAININKKNQLLLTGRMNNCGMSLEGMTRSMDNYTGIYATEPLPQPFLYSPTAQTPPVSRLYYLRNKSYYAGLNYLHAFTQEQTLRLNVLYYRDHSLNRDSIFNRYTTGEDTVAIFENNDISDKQELLKGALRYELNSKRLYLTEEAQAMLGIGNALNRGGSNLGALQEGVRRRQYDVQNVLEATVNTNTLLFDVSSIVRFYGSRERLGVTFDDGNGNADYAVRLRNLFTRNRIGTNFGLLGGSLSLGYIMEYKHNSASGGGAEGKWLSSYWLHTLEPQYELNLPDGTLTLTLPLEYISYSSPRRGVKTRKVMFSPMLDIDYRLGTMATIDLNIGINRNADTRTTPFGDAIANNYRTVTLGTDSMSFSRTAMAGARLSWLNTATMLSWNVYVGWQQEKADRYYSYLYAGDMTVIMPVWRDNRHTSWSAAANVKKVFRSARLTLRGTCSYSYNKALASQNGTEGYLRYSAASVQAGASWDKLSWIAANLACAGNITWKRRDVFSPSNNVLKNAYCSLRLDFMPSAKLRIYADAAGTTCEITHGRYSTDFFVNAGARMEVMKTLAFTLSAVNLLDRKSYETSAYRGSNYSYFSVPLRGRTVMFSATLKF